MSFHMRFGLSRPRWWQILGFIAVSSLAALRATSVQADPTIITFESPTYTTGSINNQDGWVFTGPFDVAVVAQATYPTFQAQSLRMSNASTSGSFGNMPFSKSIPNDAGETGVPTGGQSGGTRQSSFEAEFSFASTVPGVEQPGLRITVSPDRGDGARMAFAAIRDTATGLAVDLSAYDPTDPDPDACARFQPAVEIAGSLDRTVPHKLKFKMRFVDGPRNDVVQIFVDDVLKATTPSWEDYFRECAAEITNNGGVSTSRTVDSLLFRFSGTAVPTTNGNGFFIDNMSLNSGPAAAVSTVFVRTDGSDTACDGTVNVSLASAPAGQCAFLSLPRAVSGVNSGGTVNVAAGTYTATAITVIDKPVTIIGDGKATTIIDGNATVATGLYSNTSISNLTVKKLKLTNFTLDGVMMEGNSALSDILFEDFETSSNGRYGFYITPHAGQTVNNFTFRRVTASTNTGPGGRGIWMINGTKTNVTIEDGVFNGNALVGIDLSEGSVANAIITGNTVSGNGDSGIGVLGPKTAMSLKNNTITNNGRFGIEIKNPDGLTSGTPTLIVEENTVTGPNGVGTDDRDYAGIIVMRRSPGAGNADQPAGVLIRNNEVSNFKRTSGSPSDGIGIVVEGSNMLVSNNIVGGNNVGVQVQAGNTLPCTGGSSGARTPTGCTTGSFFDRGNATSYSGVVELNDIRPTNTIGLRAVGSVTANSDVTRNWWGKSSGPTNATLNPTGTGSSVAVSNGATIDFTPFLGHGTDTSGAIGFQPDLTPLTIAHVRLDGSDTECDGSADAAFNAALLGACAVATAQQGVNNVLANGTVQIGAGTFSGAAGQVNTAKTVTIQGASRATTIIDGLGTQPSHGIQFLAGTNGAAVKNLTVKRFLGHGIFAGGPLTNFTVDTTEASNNGIGNSGRGIVVWDAFKNGVTITNNIANNNGLVGIGLQDGSASGVTITGNTVSGNVDSGIFALGLKGPGANLIANNTVTDNGRFGIDISLPNGSGAVSGAGSIVVEGNTVSRTLTATRVEDHAGIMVIRRSSFVSVDNADVDTGVVVRNNDVSGIRANAPASTGEGFCIVVEGTNMTVRNNNTSNCDVGIQVQQGNTLNQQNTPGFDRGDAAAFSGIVELNNVETVSASDDGIRGIGLTSNVNATRNWFGSASGPTNATNPGGTGSTLVGAFLTFSPWLADGTDTSASIGFQPNLTPLGFLNTQGINVAPSSGLVTTENGGTASFAIVLASAPTANVQIGLTSSDTNEGTVSPASVTFTTSNWNVPQTITVTGVGLGAANGNAAYTIVTAAAVSTDPSFNGLNPTDVSVTNNAATLPAASIADTTLDEPASSIAPMTFNVTLNIAPVRAFTVQYATQDQTAVSPSDFVAASGTLTFAAGQTTKTVTVQAQADSNNTENPETFLVNLTNPVGGSIADAQATGTINPTLLQAATLCDPRPNISVTTQNVGGRQMQVTIKADTASPNGSNVLTQIQFGTPTNATLQMAGQSSIGTSPINLPTGTRQIVVTVTQTNAGAAFQVPFKIVDGCGSVDKFVGGGANSLAN